MLYIQKKFVNDSVSPWGIDEKSPRFSWQSDSGTRGGRQSAYRIIVASAAEALDREEGDFWDSAEVASTKSINIPYTGRALTSATRYFWKVCLRDEAGTQGPWSEAGIFGTGILDEKDWLAEWIGDDLPESPDLENKMATRSEIEQRYGDIPVAVRSLLLRRDIILPKPIRHAVAFICGLGMNVLHINGRKVGDSVLTPAKTDYCKQVLYEAHEVTACLRQGANVLGIHLGNGWYNPPKKYWGWQMQWHGAKRALLQIHVEYADGTSDRIITNGDWSAHDGPVLESCIYDGETYDAREEAVGWNLPGFTASDWRRAVTLRAPGGRLRFHALEPVMVMELRRPVCVWQAEPGVYIADFGQNFSGFCELRVTGERGRTVTIRHAEDISAAGFLDPVTNGDALNTDRYILRGGDSEVYRPSFTYHGFRYAEVRGYPGAFTPESILGCVIHTGCAQAGYFQCSDAEINHIHACTVWSQRSNMLGLPTDDNQRAERLGWLADGHIVCKQFSCNFESSRFYRKWLRDLACSQDPISGDIAHVSPRPHSRCSGTPVWSSAYPLVVWHLYETTGDRSVLEEHISGVRNYVAFLSSTATDHLLPPDRYGDWCSSADGMRNGDPEMISTWYYLLDLQILARIERILGNQTAATEYSALAEAVRESFNRHFFEAARTRYGRGTQTETALPLWLGLEPAGQRAALFGQLLRDIEFRSGGHLRAGIIGARHILELLSSEGRRDVVWQILTHPGFPGWIDMTQGMTTLSEAWSHKAEAGSHNHVMFGSVDAWFYQELAGIQAHFDEAGDFRLSIRPYIVDGLDWARAAIPTPYGQVAAGWHRDGEQVRVDVVIPANVEGSLLLPALQIRGARIYCGKTVVCDAGFIPGEPGILECEVQDRDIHLRLGSGAYSFSFNWVPESALTPRLSRSGFWHSPFLTDWYASPLCPPVVLEKVPCRSWKDETLRGGWMPVAGDPFVNVHSLYLEDGLVYLATRISVPQDGRWILHTGHDGGIRLFVDGEAVICEPVRINPAPKLRTSAQVFLAKGEHVLTIAFDTDNGGGWGFFFSFEVPAQERTAGALPEFPRVLPLF